MKTLIPFLIFIAWSVWQARRKAMRERERQERMMESASTEIPGTTYERSNEEPPELEEFLKYARLRFDGTPNVRSVEQLQIEQPLQTAAEPEDLTGLLPEVDPPEYRATASVVDKRFTDLRTYFVMREVLGPPRSKKRFHPRLKAQD